MKQHSERTDISVIVTLHNQSLENLIFTLESCIKQEGVVFDIVIADDCSTIDYSSEIHAFFKAHRFPHYEIVRQTENVKTVSNIKSALAFARGNHIMTIGTDDIFYESSTLAHIVRFCKDNECSMGFGKIIAFHPEKKKNAYFEFEAPLRKNLYINNASNSKILHLQLKETDWIPGGAQFIERELLAKLLDELENQFGIRYCEDFAATLALLDPQVSICFLDEYLIYYSIGYGISTSTNKQKPVAIYKDHEHLYKGMDKEKPYGKSIKFALYSFYLRRFIALHTPIYHWLRKLEAARKSSIAISTPDDFFKECLAASKEYLSI